MKREIKFIIIGFILLFGVFGFNYIAFDVFEYLTGIKYLNEISYFMMYPFFIGITYGMMRLWKHQNKIIEDGGSAEWSLGLMMAGLFYMDLFILSFIMNGWVIL